MGTNSLLDDRCDAAPFDARCVGCHGRLAFKPLTKNACPLQRDQLRALWKFAECLAQFGNGKENAAHILPEELHDSVCYSYRGEGLGFIVPSLPRH